MWGVLEGHNEIDTLGIWTQKGISRESIVTSLELSKQLLKWTTNLAPLVLGYKKVDWIWSYCVQALKSNNTCQKWV